MMRIKIISYDIIKDMLGGGYSAAKVSTDFQSSMALNRNVISKKCFDATIVGFDPLARSPIKVMDLIVSKFIQLLMKILKRNFLK